MRWSLLLLSILGLVVASPIEIHNDGSNIEESDVRNSILEAQLHQLIEEFRKTMIQGSNNLPVLDPFVLDYLSVDDNVLPVPNLKAEVHNTHISNMSSFVVNQLSLQRTTLLPLRYRLSVDLAIPNLRIDNGHYDFSVPFEGRVIFGKGDAIINIVEPRISGHVIVRPVFGLGSLFIRLEQSQLEFNLKSFRPQITGLLGGSEGVNAFVNVFLGHFVPDLINLYKTEIADVINSLTLEYGNELLSGINLIDIIG